MEMVTVTRVRLHRDGRSQLIRHQEGARVVGFTRDEAHIHYAVLLTPPPGDAADDAMTWVMLIGDGTPIDACHDPRYIGSVGAMHLVELTEPF
jgi:hypothetical protein